MKRFLIPIVLAALPLFTFSQQKSSATTQQQLEKEMEKLRTELQIQIQALQDSLVRLKAELNKKDAEKAAGYSWSYKYRLPDYAYMQPYLDDIERYFEEHEDEMRELPGHIEIPDLPEPPGMPGCEPHFELEPPAPPTAPHWEYRLEI